MYDHAQITLELFDLDCRSSHALFFQHSLTLGCGFGNGTTEACLPRQERADGREEGLDATKA